MNIIQTPSSNFNYRNGVSIDMLVLHYTDTKTVEKSLSLLQDPENEVSAHFLIDEDGTVYQLVDEENRAWHAGLSYWAGVTDINSHSIGIEIQNKGHSHGYTKFPAIQMQSVIELCQKIIKQHNIPAYNVLAHSDIAPDRKQDPGYLFDWKLLAKNGIGIFPEPTKSVNEKTLKQLLIEFGYNPEVHENILIDAFKQHFIRSESQDIIGTIIALNNYIN